MDIGSSKVTPQGLMEFIDLIHDGIISGPAAKAVFEDMFKSGKRAGEIVDDKGLTQINDEGLLNVAVAEVIQRNPKPVQDFLGGKETALKFLVGQVMKETRGRANPAMINQILIEYLDTKVD